MTQLVKMNEFKLLTSLIATVLCLHACMGEEARPELWGRWQAYEIVEGERLLEVDPAEIRFTFTEEGAYEFNSTLNYREAGRYRLERGYLITQDTLAPGAPEKAVEIVQLNADTLAMRMEDQGRERIIRLLRP